MVAVKVLVLPPMQVEWVENQFLQVEQQVEWVLIMVKMEVVMVQVVEEVLGMVRQIELVAPGLVE